MNIFNELISNVFSLFFMNLIYIKSYIIISSFFSSITYLQSHTLLAFLNLLYAFVMIIFESRRRLRYLIREKLRRQSLFTREARVRKIANVWENVLSEEE